VRRTDRRLIRIGTALRMLEPRRSVKRAVNQVYSAVSQRIRMAPFNTTKAIMVATTRSGNGELKSRTSTAATMTPKFAMTSFVVKIQLAFMWAPPLR